MVVRGVNLCRWILGLGEGETGRERVKKKKKGRSLKPARHRQVRWEGSIAYSTGEQISEKIEAHQSFELQWGGPGAGELQPDFSEKHWAEVNMMMRKSYGWKAL